MRLNSRFTKIFALIGMLTLSACAKTKTPSSVFEKSNGEECAADVIPQQFVVRFTDGSMDVVRPDSEDAFLEGFVRDNLDRIEFAEPDYVVRSTSPAVRTSATGRASNWGVVRVGADTLWSQNIRGQGVVVAVVDSGLDVNHPQFAGQIHVNTGEIPGNGIDDDGNGFVDDYYGWNFVTNAGLVSDNQYHGTHVAGIVAAAHNDSTASVQDHVQGAAPGAKILPLAFLDRSGSGSMSNGVRAIKYAVSRGARVINASWGGTVCSRSLRDTIASLDEQNVLFVAAAGNDSLNIDRYKEYPASFEAAAQITVGATGEHDITAEYSNYGSKSVHIFAPGTDIVSTIPSSLGYGLLGTLSGTSMAAPLFAGAAALLLSAEPTATNAQLRQAFYATAFKQNHFINASMGRVDLRQALIELRRVRAR